MSGIENQSAPFLSPEEWYRCIDTSSSSQIGSTSQSLYASSSTLWGRPVVQFQLEDIPTTRKIPVCWLASAYSNPEYEASRSIVQEAVEKTWQRALDIPGISENEKVVFIGWQECTPNFLGVKISVEDRRPNAQVGNNNVFVSKYFPRFPTVYLNFDFHHFSTNCRKSSLDKDFCVGALAVHEFGHVLGFEHEHERPDSKGVSAEDKKSNDGLCDDQVEGFQKGSGDMVIGSWDIHSVMNYCNPQWNNHGELSRTDIYGVQRAYYPQYFKKDCGL